MNTLDRKRASIIRESIDGMRHVVDRKDEICIEIDKLDSELYKRAEHICIFMRCDTYCSYKEWVDPLEE